MARGRLDCEMNQGTFTKAQAMTIKDAALDAAFLRNLHEKDTCIQIGACYKPLCRERTDARSSQGISSSEMPQGDDTSKDEAMGHHNLSSVSSDDDGRGKDTGEDAADYDPSMDSDGSMGIRNNSRTDSSLDTVPDCATDAAKERRKEESSFNDSDDDANIREDDLEWNRKSVIDLLMWNAQDSQCGDEEIHCPMAPGRVQEKLKKLGVCIPSCVQLHSGPSFLMLF